MKEKIQRDILYELCKSIAMNRRTPDWIRAQIYQGVKKAQDVHDEFPTLNAETPMDTSIHVGSTVVSQTLDNTPYAFKVVAEKEEIEGIRLYDVQVISGHGPHKIGAIVYNVPGTWLSVGG